MSSDVEATDPRRPGRDMVWIPAGEFVMGSDHHYPDEAPAHVESVEGFWIDRRPVTNDEFARFVADTGYVTSAEVAPDPNDYPDALPEMLVAASVVFTPTNGPVDLRDHYQWWSYVPGADWRHPRGPHSSINGLGDHPVVHVAWQDVESYAAWAGADLPTEAEWEFAARGGSTTEYAWGDELAPGGRHMANTWQGTFPYRNLCLDGYEYTSPVGSFPANGYDLVDMIGNTWEWTSDWYQPRHDIAHPCCSISSGHRRDSDRDPAPSSAVARRVMKGGSHLCAPNYCRRYRPPARMPQEIDTSTSHLGFRCVVRPSPVAHSASNGPVASR